MKRQQVRAGVSVGGGPEPGYLWSVEYLTVAKDEANRFLTASQYEHVVDQLRALARERSPTHPHTVSVDAVEDFWELREKGGPLGKINVRVFFIVDPNRKMIVVLGAIKKENEGQTPPATKRLMGLRRRKYLNGDYGDRATPEPKS